MMMNKIHRLWDVLNFKTIYFNFHYLPFSQAIKFPILISRHCRIRKAQGSIRIESPVRFGMISIGRDGVGIFDNKRSRSIWQVAGTVVFEGDATIGHGCKISVEGGGFLRFGKKFACTAESSIAAIKSIVFGENCLLSWDILIMDTDWHKILNADHTIINPPQPVTIGNHVWIGCRTTILKGVTIADNSVIAAGSIVTKSVSLPNTISGGMPCKTIKKEITWEQ